MPIISRDIPRSFDPFHAPSQAGRRKCSCKIIVGNFDVTDRVEPFLMSVTVRSRSADMGDEATIELDDRDARLPIPPMRTRVQVWLGWHTEGAFQVFTGYVEEVFSTFGRRQGGRRLHIECKGADWGGPGKEPMQKVFGEGAPPGEDKGKPVKFAEVFAQAAQAGGHEGIVGGSLKTIERDFWQQNESFFHFGQRMAQELGGDFKVAGNKAVIVPRGLDIEGNALPAITAVWGDNLISWQIRPFAIRSQWGAIQSQFFDIAKAAWQNTDKKTDSSGSPWNAVSASRLLPHAAPNAQVAEQGAEGAADNEQNERGNGHVVINGEPRAAVQASCTIVGARPGVNGSYRITEVDHTYSREGFTTRLELDRPSGIDSDPKNPIFPKYAPAPSTEPAPPLPPPSDEDDGL